MNWLYQVFSITRFAIVSIPERKGSSLAAMFGIAGVVAVLVGVFSIARGFERMMTQSSAPGSVIILRTGANDEMVSAISGEHVRIISEAPEIKMTDGEAEAAGELFVIIDIAKKTTGTDVNAPMRGVSPRSSAIRQDFVIIEGRYFEWGRNEVIVGRGAVSELAGLDVGSKLEVGDEAWDVVGIFSASGGIAESEIWADAAVVQPAFKRGNSYQSVFARLESPEGFQAFKDRLTTDPRLTVKVVRQSEFYAEQSTIIVQLATILGTLVASLMALGAVFGALNTMYTAVSARTREIATLRALGFGSGPVVVSVLIESLFLAVIGGVVGGLAAYFAFDGYRASTLNWASFSQVAFAFEVSLDLLVLGTFYACLIGLLGGLFPAIRAARMPVAEALREQ